MKPALRSLQWHAWGAEASYLASSAPLVYHQLRQLGPRLPTLGTLSWCLGLVLPLSRGFVDFDIAEAAGILTHCPTLLQIGAHLFDANIHLLHLPGGREPRRT